MGELAPAWNLVWEFEAGSELVGAFARSGYRRTRARPRLRTAGALKIARMSDDLAHAQGNQKRFTPSAVGANPLANGNHRFRLGVYPENADLGG
jgi:hypothetical protein